MQEFSIPKLKDATEEIQQVVRDYNYIDENTHRSLNHEEILDILRGGYTLMEERMGHEAPRKVPHITLALNIDPSADTEPNEES